MRGCVVFLALIVCVLASDEWHCGSDYFSRRYAKTMVRVQCAQHYNDVNGCCKSHDKCYEDQKGQKLCDDVFCSCLKTKAEECGSLTDNFCTAVRSLGHDAYNDSGKKPSEAGSAHPHILRSKAAKHDYYNDMKILLI